MLAQFLQFLFSGITVGSAYALSALGFTLIYNASGIINFAQGEFIMLGGVVAAALVQAGLPLPLAILCALLAAGAVGLLVEKLAIEPAKNAEVVTLIIITIGASLVLRGLVQVFIGKGNLTLPAFSGDAPLALLGAAILPQSLWVLGATLLAVLTLGWFFARTTTGKAMLATAHNRLAARLLGIHTQRMLMLSFGLSALLGALGGILITPIATTSYDMGIMFGLKGFVAATLGGLGSGAGAIAGGLLLGLAEAMTAGYISSAYKDAVPFVLILVVLFSMPRGLFGAKVTERV
jgi:branched-chain amino acid transport system permease protein